MSVHPFECAVCNRLVDKMPAGRWIALNRWLVGWGPSFDTHEARLGDPRGPSAEDVYVWNEDPTEEPATSVALCVPDCLAIFAEMQCLEWERKLERMADRDDDDAPDS